MIYSKILCLFYVMKHSIFLTRWSTQVSTFKSTTPYLWSSVHYLEQTACRVGSNPNWSKVRFNWQWQLERVMATHFWLNWVSIAIQVWNGNAWTAMKSIYTDYLIIHQEEHEYARRRSLIKSILSIIESYVPTFGIENKKMSQIYVQICAL